MSTEIDELKKRVASLEKEFRAVFGKAETVEPAPGSDAEHPPVGYVLVPSASADKIKSDWLVWAWDQGPWQAFTPGSIGLARNQSDYAVSRPIPANEGDSRLAESVAIPTEPARDLSAEVETQKKLDLQWEAVKALEAERNALIGERSELCATVERLEAECAELRKTNRSYHMTITELNDRLRMVREAAR